ncbi:Pantothenate permease [Slackia heliotrinireducens]|uniref:Sodium/pantothenate symporter n=1 Tax=Slackia heliotrinireducens (strain ATCC 29202 / DSM 20476 / NCTC 11029 / RHS 1) TaxID=471855 RepID=C7N304_SLAHD|nr:sodium/pantothenate symporter [Slackia heliotrinireducens]ACV21525.1 sodium/pantothenate symporter [Slackia heliotrinireducens DSM 20476]VEG98995.1 Pantothenate permease [Slackia heliotrinireducens]
MSANIAGILPVLLFLAFAMVVAIVVRRRAAKQAEQGFVKEYFIGNRGLGAFVLAMTTIATYGSVSSFVGGPGQAWNIGWGWVYMAAVQVTTLFLLYGIMGKKMALVSRKTGAVTVIDVIRERYQSDALAIIAAVIMVLFFATTMIAQFVGGAKLFEYVTGYSYNIGLIIFGVACILFTTIGGFRGVAVTDALCGIAMLVGIAVLAGGILNAGGGYEAVMTTIATNHPEMMEPLSGGNMPYGLYFTQWLLVGIFTFCLPQSVVRTMGYKDTKSLHNAMIWGTVILGAMMIGVTSLGVLSAGVLTDTVEAYGGSIDNIIPQAIVQTLPSWLAGVAIIGPIAASISTVSSLLIASSSAIIKDIWLHHCEAKGALPEDKLVRNSSQAITLLLGAIVFILSIVPPEVIWKINMFAFGGLETAFCWVLVGGLFWKRANKYGAILSMAGGVLVYCLAMYFGFKIGGLHQITIGITVSFILMIIGSLATKADDPKRLEMFFPSK